MNLFKIEFKILKIEDMVVLLCLHLLDIVSNQIFNGHGQ